MSAEQIDAERLAHQIRWAREMIAAGMYASRLTDLADAADAHLSTLPRVKEVEVEGWMVVNRNGVPVCAHQHEMAARYYIENGGVSGDRVVRLTGTAKVRA